MEIRWHRMIALVGMVFWAANAAYAQKKATVEINYLCRSAGGMVLTCENGIFKNPEILETMCGKSSSHRERLSCNFGPSKLSQTFSVKTSDFYLFGLEDGMPGHKVRCVNSLELSDGDSYLKPGMINDTQLPVLRHVESKFEESEYDEPYFEMDILLTQLDDLNLSMVSERRKETTLAAWKEHVRGATAMCVSMLNQKVVMKENTRLKSIRSQAKGLCTGRLVETNFNPLSSENVWVSPIRKGSCMTP